MYLVQDPGHGTSVMGVMKMGNNVPSVGLEPTSLAFQASVLPLHHVASPMSPRCPPPPVYVALCLRVQYRLLQYYHILEKTSSNIPLWSGDSLRWLGGQGR